MKNESVSVADLLLDVHNPRHSVADNQREAINLLIEEQGEKLYRLAADIAESGLSPIDNLLVMQNRNGTYTVIEGNRRVASLKLITNPALASGRPLEARLRALPKGNVPAEVLCAIASSREEAKHWQLLRHTGENNGTGVVTWNSEAVQRFSGRRGSHSEKGVAFLDAVRKAYPRSANIDSWANEVSRNKLTTLGRLMADPDVRSALGITFDDGEMLSHYPARDVAEPVERMLNDLANDLTVTELKTKAQRRKYMGKMRDILPDPDLYQPTARPLSSLGARAAGPAKKKVPSRASTPPNKLFRGVRLSNLGSRVQAILSELQKLDLAQFPNASAVLLRAVLELSIDQVYDAKGWTPQQKFRDRVKYCLRQIDSTQKDPVYQAIRTGLSDGHSIMAVATLHGYVHNPAFHPTATDLRGIAHNLSPFLVALDGLV